MTAHPKVRTASPAERDAFNLALSARLSGETNPQRLYADGPAGTTFFLEAHASAVEAFPVALAVYSDYIRQCGSYQNAIGHGVGRNAEAAYQWKTGQPIVAWDLAPLNTPPPAVVEEDEDAPAPRFGPAPSLLPVATDEGYGLYLSNALNAAGEEFPDYEGSWPATNSRWSAIATERGVPVVDQATWSAAPITDGTWSTGGSPSGGAGA